MEYARKVVRVRCGPGVFEESVLLADGGGAVTATDLAEHAGEKAAPPGALEYKVTRQPERVELTVATGGVSAREVEVEANSRVVRLRIKSQKAAIVLPCRVGASGASAVRFLKKRQLLQLDMPVESLVK